MIQFDSFGHDSVVVVGSTKLENKSTSWSSCQYSNIGNEYWGLCTYIYRGTNGGEVGSSALNPLLNSLRWMNWSFGVYYIIAREFNPAQHTERLGLQILAILSVSNEWPYGDQTGVHCAYIWPHFQIQLLFKHALL